ncbi:hypothetical protein ABZ281_28020 [Streptomyces sp. NPDC006265]|uniref:hypothetical protein n=1 Tax=Streptomyces sp. NPDC006265 TaxID=3156740 RepID=UPI0033BA2A9A
MVDTFEPSSTYDVVGIAPSAPEEGRYLRMTLCGTHLQETISDRVQDVTLIVFPSMLTCTFCSSTLKGYISMVPAISVVGRPICE